MTGRSLARTEPESKVNRRDYLEQALKYKANGDHEGEKYFRNLAHLEWLNNRFFLGPAPF